MSLKRFHESRRLARSWRNIARAQQQRMQALVEKARASDSHLKAAQELATMLNGQATAMCAIFRIPPGQYQAWKIPPGLLDKMQRDGRPKIDMSPGADGMIDVIVSFEERPGQKLFVVKGGMVS